ncbi:MAG TPA: hypothetical protein VE338_15555 [Ktedonobacterales bacterium]|nr:hypothetical protein [Ktedonobacterales bacterium]
MTDDETLSELMAQVAAMRAALVEQQATISDLRAEVRELRAASLSTPAVEPLATLRPVASSAPESVQSAQPAQSRPARTGTSRRGLLRGAAAATAAATVSAVALGASEQAHAAPQATGGNFILGATNDAGAATVLQPTSGTTPVSLLTLNNTARGAIAITTNTASGNGVSATDSGAGSAIYGRSAGGSGVTAVSSSGTALYASSTTGMGVQGTSTSLYGNSSYGVRGDSQSSYGVVGYSVSSDDLAAIGTGRIYQKLQSHFGPPTTGTYIAGDSLRDSIGDLWLCVWGDGTSLGQWAKVALLAPSAFAGGAITYLGKPIRIFDSRAGATDALFHPGTPCTSSAPTTVPVGDDVYNGVTVPHAPPGAIGNVTVVNATGSGYIELVPGGAGFTGAANLAYGPGQTISNAFNVQLNGGALDIIIGGASVDVIIDLFAIVS